MSETTTPQPTTTTTTTEATTTTNGLETTTTTKPPLPDTTTRQPTTTTPEPTTTTVTTTTTTTTTTTVEPLRRIFACDFSDTICFQDTQLIITNGTEVPLLNITEPPRAPLSDVTSTTQPTSNDQLCSLPYQLVIDDDNNTTNTTDWDMWFCYNNQCPTRQQQQESGNCTSGNYGLVFVDPNESNKTISTSISDGVEVRSASAEHCLAYYYYFTVYDGADWGQQLSVWTRVDDGEDEVDRVLVGEMSENRWYQRHKTLSAAATSTNYTLSFLFEVRNVSGGGGGEEGWVRTKTIYFAVDNIEVYNRNCDEVLNPSTTTMSSAPMTGTGETTTHMQSTSGLNTTEQTSTPANLGLMLGLSLGIGIPVLLAVIGLVYYFCVVKSRPKVVVQNSSEGADIPMTPRNTNTNGNKTVTALVV